MSKLKIWIGFVFVTTALYLSVSAACKKSVYILPLITKESRKESDYPFSLYDYVRECSITIKESNREQISLLLPNYTQFTPCFLGTRGDCDSIAIGLDEVLLPANKNYSIQYNLDKLLKADFNPSCTDDSVGIILTDIPYANIKNYPDIDQLFNTQLEKTIKNFNTEYFLHTVILWLTPNISNPDYEPPEKLRKYPFLNTSDFLELEEVQYADLRNYVYLCDKTFLSIRNGSNLSVEAMDVKLRNGLIIGSSIFFFFLLILIVFCAFRVRRRYLESRLEFFADQHANANKNRARRLFFGENRPMDEWEITPKELKVDANVVLGTGISATVYKGILKRKVENQTIELEVAVKFAHSYADSTTRKDMIREIEFMKTLGKHDNLLVMIGCVKDPESPVIVTEFAANGDLLKIIRKHDLHFLTSEKCSEVEICFLLVDLLRIASQVCSGMAHLASLKYVHRDLAARNVMIMSDMTARVGDFGLCRLASESLYIQKGGKLPIKHMPYEALKFGEFSEKSDVWSYGVLLFEMFTGGQRPFSDIETEELIKHLEGDGKPEFPEDVPEQLIRMLNLKCFDQKSANRGTFAEIQEEIDKILEMFDI